MQYLLLALTLLATFYLWRTSQRPIHLPRINQPAPDFALPDQDGTVRSLGDWSGRWLVLFCYPKDDTRICTREACTFEEQLPALQAEGIAVAGINTDTVESHARFATRHHLTFPLLADTEGTTLSRYGSLYRLGPLKMARRDTWLIDPEGRVAAVYLNVDPRGHAERIRADVRRLQQARSA